MSHLNLTPDDLKFQQEKDDHISNLLVGRQKGKRRASHGGNSEHRQRVARPIKNECNGQ